MDYKKRMNEIIESTRSSISFTEIKEEATILRKGRILRKKMTEYPEDFKKQVANLRASFTRDALENASANFEDERYEVSEDYEDEGYEEDYEEDEELYY